MADMSDFEPGYLYDLVDSEQDERDVDTILDEFCRLCGMEDHPEVPYEPYDFGELYMRVTVFGNRTFILNRPEKAEAFCKLNAAMAGLLHGVGREAATVNTVAAEPTIDTAPLFYIVDYIIEALKNAELGIKLGDIQKRVEAMGYKSTANLKRTIHNTMKKRPDLFVQPTYGYWMLTKYYYAPLSLEESEPRPDTPSEHLPRKQAAG